MTEMWAAARREVLNRLREGKFWAFAGGWLVILAALVLVMGLALGRPGGSVPSGLMNVFGIAVWGGIAVAFPIAVYLMRHRDDRTLWTGRLLGGWMLCLLALIPAVVLAVVALVGATGVRPARVLLTIVFAAFAVAVVAVVAAIPDRWYAIALLLVLSVGAPLAYALAMPLTRSTDAVISPSGVPYEVEQDHPEKIWWLLAASPFVLAADAPPAAPTIVERSGDVILSEPADLLGGMAELAREARQPFGAGGREPEDYAADWPVWPLGLIVHSVIGAAAVVATARTRHRPER